MTVETTNPDLVSPVTPDSPLKQMIVNYVGDANKLDEGDNVNVAMIVEQMAKDFPEFLLAVAEENWIRGYHQALTDVSEGEKVMREMEEEKKKMGNNLEEFISLSDKKAKKQNKEYYLYNSILVFMKDPFPVDIDVDAVLKRVEAKIPSSMVTRTLDAVYIGSFPHCSTLATIPQNMKTERYTYQTSNMMNKISSGIWFTKSLTRSKIYMGKKFLLIGPWRMSF